jgi:hypothetical protein
VKVLTAEMAVGPYRAVADLPLLVVIKSVAELDAGGVVLGNGCGAVGVASEAVPGLPA